MRMPRSSGPIAALAVCFTLALAAPAAAHQDPVKKDPVKKTSSSKTSSPRPKRPSPPPVRRAPPRTPTRPTVKRPTVKRDAGRTARPARGSVDRGDRMRDARSSRVERDSRRADDRVREMRRRSAEAARSSARPVSDRRGGFGDPIVIDRIEEIDRIVRTPGIRGRFRVIDNGASDAEKRRAFEEILRMFPPVGPGQADADDGTRRRGDPDEQPDPTPPGDEADRRRDDDGGRDELRRRPRDNGDPGNDRRDAGDDEDGTPGTGEDDGSSGDGEDDGGPVYRNPPVTDFGNLHGSWYWRRLDYWFDRYFDGYAFDRCGSLFGASVFDRWHGPHRLSRRDQWLFATWRHFGNTSDADAAVRSGCLIRGRELTWQEYTRHAEPESEPAVTCATITAMRDDGGAVRFDIAMPALGVRTLDDLEKAIEGRLDKGERVNLTAVLEPGVVRDVEVDACGSGSSR